MATTRVGKRRVTFSLAVPGATSVFLAGDFNGWDETFPMDMKANGKFEKKLMLPPGEFEYKFIVDDQWMADPQNDQSRPNCFGSVNSLIRIIS